MPWQGRPPRVPSPAQSPSGGARPPQACPNPGQNPTCPLQRRAGCLNQSSQRTSTTHSATMTRIRHSAILILLAVAAAAQGCADYKIASCPASSFSSCKACAASGACCEFPRGPHFTANQPRPARAHKPHATLTLQAWTKAAPSSASAAAQPTSVSGRSARSAAARPHKKHTHPPLTRPCPPARCSCRP